jgi:hypothetical protein
LIPNIPSNATPKEIVDIIRHNYPNLGPQLNRLVVLTETYVEDLCLLEQDKNIEDDDDSSADAVEAFIRETNEEGRCKCTHCGSTVEIPQPTEK